jgi:DNA-directed RNA polymerase specialized sigma24 family protein
LSRFCRSGDKYFSSPGGKIAVAESHILLALQERMQEYSFAGVNDFGEVLDRLVLYAQNLGAGLVCTGAMERSLPGGDGAEDLAMSVLCKFIDPNDATVAWSEQKGEPTTDKVLAYLKKVLQNDFFDLKKSKRYTTTSSLESYEEEGNGRTLDELAVTYCTPEGETLKQERAVWLLNQFNSEPELQAIVKLLFDPAGFAAFTNQELAQLLNISVKEIENCKKRIKVRLAKLAASRNVEGAKYV